MIDLSNLFVDNDNKDTTIGKSVDYNNSSLFSAKINGNNLIIDYKDNQYGTADVTITGHLRKFGGKRVQDTFTVNVNPIDDPPFARNDTGSNFTTDEDTTFTTVNVLSNDFHPDGDTLTITNIDTTPTLGQVIDNGDGTFNYDPDGQFESLKSGETVTDSFSYTITDGNSDFRTATVTITINGVSDLNTSIDRFQNRSLPGTYLFTGAAESQSIRAHFPNFVEEGQAFKVAVEPDDDLIRLNRFQNSNVPGTYLYAGEAESQNIRQNFPNFVEEGVAFYVYPGSADICVDFYRFQNLDVPGTYIFVGEAERQNILANYPNFAEEGIAFEVEI